MERYKDKDKEKEVNLDDVIKYLSRAFSRAAVKAAIVIGPRAHRFKERKSGLWKTTPMYDYQVDFCYLMDNILRAPRYVSTKSIHRVNELIAQLEAENS